MNQEKIGKLIAKCRNDKNMTQQMLAEKLGVTDKAISKWENGRCLPDLSLIKPLCKELEITINELLSGEKIKEESYQEKFEENILNTLNYTDKKIKKKNKTFNLVTSGILIFIIILVTLFCIDISKMNNNEPVFFSTWGFEYAPPINLQEEEIENAIKEYLITKNDNNLKHHDNEKTFISIKTYLIEEKDNGPLYNVYAWVLEESYYLENDEIKQDSGSSIPYKFVVETIDNEYVVTDSRIPRDGSYYSDDMKNIFPRSVRNDMNKVHTDGTIERLQLDIQEQLKLYFHQ